MKRLLLAVLCVAGLAAQEASRTPVESAPARTEESDKIAVWKWVNFVMLAGGLGYLMAKHLPPFFRTRTGEIQSGIAEAQQKKRDAEKRAAEMDARLNALGAEIEKFRTQAKAEMQLEADRIRRETADQIQKLEQQAAREIEAAGKTTRRELREYAAHLALDRAEQRIRARLDQATEGALVDDFVNNLQRQESQN